jgi:hypothetical protein
VIVISEVKLNEMIDAKMPPPGEFIEFEGMNCDDPDYFCRGWDGVSPRCDCGNRRVSWDLSDDETYVYAEAY